MNLIAVTALNFKYGPHMALQGYVGDHMALQRVGDRREIFPLLRGVRRFLQPIFLLK